ncbi:MAG: hypothetical protein ABGY75_18890 [Gemmataceae bacterium]
MSDRPRASRKSRRRPLAPLAVDAAGLAVLLGVSKRSVISYTGAGLLPSPFQLAAPTLWSVPEIRRWPDAGSPDRAACEPIKAATKR